MSATSNTPNKIAKFRTFAQDAEKHANQSIDKVRTEQAQSKIPKKDHSQPEVVDLDQVDTTETTDNPTSSIPPKSTTEADTATKETKDSSPTSTKTEKDERDISNPPFHKLAAERKKASEKITASSETISNHPESLLSKEQKQTVNVDDDEATAEATIVTDTKTSRKSVLEDIGESVSDWFAGIKNTYITPPKPSYTISKSERRAGILKDATAKTGTDLVDHDSFASRIRERYQSASTPDIAVETEPAWLPSLPAGSKKRDIHEVQTIPRKGVQTPLEEQKAASKKEVAATATDSEAPDRWSTKKEAEDLSEEKETSITTSGKLNQGTKKSKTFSINEPKVTATKPTIPTTPLEKKVDKETAPVIKSIPKPPTPPATGTAKTEEVVTPQPPTTPTKNTVPEKETPAVKTTVQAPAPVPETQTVVTPAAAEPSAPATQPEPLKPTTPPATPVRAEEYILPSDQELDEEAVWADRQATNRLSLGIVLGTVAAVVAGIIVYSIVPLFLNQDTDSSATVTTPFGTGGNTISADDWDNTLARTEAVRQSMNAETSSLHYITLTTDTGPVTDPAQFARLLNVTIPVGVQTSVQTIHAGNYQGIPFLYLYAPDTPQILGALLTWESSLATDLQSLLPITDYSGTFIDMVIADSYDARVKQTDTNISTLTYVIVGDYVLITTTPEAAAATITALE